jgi:3-vinyl bacteriochlorophyllide hydratase
LGQQRHYRTANGGLSARAPLYTPEQRQRRDATRWTLVQGILAPIQILIAIVSAFLVIRYLRTGDGETLATASIILKTLTLYTIMVTGSIWEKVVFGKWLFAEPFYWEDMVSMAVIALHTLYLAALIFDWWSTRERMLLALVAYAVYLVNAVQFILKLRMARLDSARAVGAPEAVTA